MYTAELEITFENGSKGSKTFESHDKQYVHYKADQMLIQIIQYAKAKQKNLVKSHKIVVRDH